MNRLLFLLPPRLGVTLGVTLLVTLLVPLAVGCVQALRETPQEQQYYMLAVEPGEALPAINDASLGLRTLRISPGYRTRHLLYRTGEQSFQTDYYHLFLDRPQDMITHAVRLWLSRRGPFDAVLSAGSSAEPQWMLEGNVVRLHGDFTVEPPVAVLQMEFFLLQLDGMDYQPAWQTRLRIEEPIARGNAAAVVEGLTRALVTMLEQLQDEMRVWLAGRE